MEGLGDLGVHLATVVVVTGGENASELVEEGQGGAVPGIEIEGGADDRIQGKRLVDGGQKAVDAFPGLGGDSDGAAVGVIPFFGEATLEACRRRLRQREAGPFCS